MSDIAELERRITAALERISRGLDAGPSVMAALSTAVDVTAKDAEIARLTSALAEEKATSARLAAQAQEAQRSPREKEPRDKEPMSPAAVDERLERMTRQLDVQGLELQRMRKTATALREQLRIARQAMAAGLGDPQLVNKAMLTELEALRATRLTEMAEMDDIIAELTPLIEEAEHA